MKKSRGSKLPNPYSKMETVVGKQIDERLPFNCFEVKRDWDGIREWLSKNHTKLRKLQKIDEKTNMDESIALSVE